MNVVCITGMHRSGTSMVTRLLKDCGVYLGDNNDILPPAADNPEGFWENRKFVSLNDEILAQLGGAWDIPPVVKPGWEFDDEIVPYREKAKKIIENFADFHFWGWKDPRNSLTLPFWREIIPELKVVFCVRNPLEVAHSLSHRNMSSPLLGYNLWLQYNQQILAQYSSGDFIVTGYESYFDDPLAELKRVLGFLKIEVSDKQIRDAAISISHSLYNNRDIQLGYDEIIPIDVMKIFKRLITHAGPIYQSASQKDKTFELILAAKDDNFEKELLKAKLTQQNQREAYYKKTIDMMKAELLAGEQAIARKEQVIAEKEQAIGEKEQVIAEKEQAIGEKEQVIAEKEQVIGEKEQVIAEKEQVIASQGDLISKKEDIIDGLLTQTSKIMDSTIWKILQKIVRIREVFIPYGTNREKIYNGILSGFSIMRTEGWAVSFRTVYQKLFPKKTGFSHVVTSLDTRPLVSIVVPVFNSAKFTKECVKNIYDAVTQVPFEVLIIDNHSTDSTNRYLQSAGQEFPNFQSFRMTENLGFAGAVNYGIRQCQGEYIVILNNDTLVTNGWLDALLEPFGKDKMIGMVSPVTNYVGSGLQLDIGAINITTDQIQSYADGIRDRSFIYETNRLVFFCVAIRGDVFDIVGELDTRYEKGNFEDDDYCMRTIIAGYKLAIAQNSFVYHFGSVTFKNSNIPHTDYMERNRKRFFDKAQNIAVNLRPPQHRGMDALVSVVIRTKNRHGLLHRALTSLSNQTYKTFEVIVVNDGGEDVSSTLDIFRNHYRLEQIHNTTSVGRSAALNIGVRNCAGNWISFLDDDDIVYPWHLDALTSATQRQSGYEVFYSDYNRSLFLSIKDKYPQRTIGVEPWKYDPERLMVQNFMPIHTWLISQDAIQKAGGFDAEMDMLEDYEFLIRLSKSFDFYHVQNYTCEYRYYQDGVNSMATQRWKTLDALRYTYNKFPTNNPYLLKARKYELASLKAQIGKIEKLQSALSDDDAVNTKIYREIIHLVAGI